MGILSNLICEWRHRASWHDRAEGDWIIRNCSRCDMTWPIPRLGSYKIYTRKDGGERG